MKVKLSGSVKNTVVFASSNAYRKNYDRANFHNSTPRTFYRNSINFVKITPKLTSVAIPCY